jgi:hypothetical protein
MPTPGTDEDRAATNIVKMIIACQDANTNVPLGENNIPLLEPLPANLKGTGTGNALESFALKYLNGKKNGVGQPLVISRDAMRQWATQLGIANNPSDLDGYVDRCLTNIAMSKKGDTIAAKLKNADQNLKKWSCSVGEAEKIADVAKQVSEVPPPVKGMPFEQGRCAQIISSWEDANNSVYTTALRVEKIVEYNPDAFRLLLVGNQKLDEAEKPVKDAELLTEIAKAAYEIKNNKVRTGDWGVDAVALATAYPKTVYPEITGAITSLAELLMGAGHAFSSGGVTLNPAKISDWASKIPGGSQGETLPAKGARLESWITKQLAEIHCGGPGTVSERLARAYPTMNERHSETLVESSKVEDWAAAKVDGKTFKSKESVLEALSKLTERDTGLKQTSYREITRRLDKVAGPLTITKLEDILSGKKKLIDAESERGIVEDKPEKR